MTRLWLAVLSGAVIISGTFGCGDDGEGVAPIVTATITGVESPVVTGAEAPPTEPNHEAARQPTREADESEESEDSEALEVRENDPVRERAVRPTGEASSMVERTIAEESPRPLPRSAPRGPARPEPPVLEPTLVDTSGLGVSRMVMARGVEERAPVDESVRFSAADSGRIYAFLEIQNPEGEERDITLTWRTLGDGARNLSSVEVHVGPHRRWRTWAYTRQLRTPGRYEAIVRDHEDRVIARHPFVVTR